MKYSIQKLWLSLVCMIVGTAAWGQNRYQLVTSVDQLETGCKYVIGSSKENGYFMSNLVGDKYRPQTANKAETKDYIVVISDTTLILTLGGTKGAWTFWTENYSTNGYLNATDASSNNYLRIKAEDDIYNKFSISIQDNNTATIKCTGKNYKDIMGHGNNNQFGCYSSSNFDSNLASPVYLYKQTNNTVATASITLNAACHDENGKVFSTYSSSVPFVVPENLTISEIGINDGKLNVQPYNTGAIVPANTGVMVSASAGGDYTVNLCTVAGTSVLGDANRLRTSGPSGITADAMRHDANCLYYRLTMHNGTQIGFWWGAENGAAFPLAANKAYLAVPQTATSAKMGMWFGSEGDPTAINATGSKPAEAAIFNLHGQHISHLQKGVNIVEGKKIIR